jgi:hypothetical protein
MKKTILKFAAIVLIAGFTTIAASAQHFYVKVRPTARVVVRPAAPSPKHVWVGSEWSWSNGHYVEVPGHWIVPPHGMRTWVPGHWNNTRSGSEWIGGHWA